MVTIPRSLARRLRLVLSRALGVTPRSNTPRIQIRSGEHGLTISAVGHDAAVSYHDPTQSGTESLAVPFELLKRCEGTKNEPVMIGCQDGETVARWTDAGIPQIAQYPTTDCEHSLPLPDVMQANDSEDLLTALRNAVESADREATRYALNCIRLRGSDGQIAGTDGRQLFIHHGFSFPWDGELIVPASRVFTCADLDTGEPVEIGSTDSWAVLRSGPWTIHLRIEKEARFPDVDRIIPQPIRTQSTLRLSGSDARFLQKALQRMPANDHLNSPVTVDLNGSVSIRAKGDDQPAAPELVLTGSHREGDALRFNTQRGYLSRAVRMGFRDVDLTEAESPACCRDGRRAYVWGLLSKEGAILSNPDAIRIESPAESGRATAPGRRPTGRSSASGATPAVSSDASAESEAASVACLIQNVEAVEKSLHELLSRTSVVIESLKRRHPPKSLTPPTAGSTTTLQDQAAA